MAVLISQAQAYQRQQCTYHNAPPPGALPGAPGDSLYVDHECDMAVFPRVTTLILDEHMDEVWNLSWNHAGTHLATAGKDKRAIVWKIGVGPLSTIGEPRLTSRL
jgi:WD repeat-containing protein 26